MDTQTQWPFICLFSSSKYLHISFSAFLLHTNKRCSFVERDAARYGTHFIFSHCLPKSLWCIAVHNWTMYWWWKVDWTGRELWTFSLTAEYHDNSMRTYKYGNRSFLFQTLRTKNTYIPAQMTDDIVSTIPRIFDIDRAEYKQPEHYRLQLFFICKDLNQRRISVDSNYWNALPQRGKRKMGKIIREHRFGI